MDIKEIIDFDLGAKLFHGKEKHELFVKSFYEKDLGELIEKIGFYVKGKK